MNYYNGYCSNRLAVGWFIDNMNEKQWKWKINSVGKLSEWNIPEGIRSNGLENVRDIYAYYYKKGQAEQYYVVDKPKKKFIVNHFVFSTGVADWIEKKYIKEGKKPTPKKYHQNVAIDYDTRREANTYIIKQFSNKE